MDNVEIVPAAMTERDVVSVARDVVSRLAPEELPLFGQAADEWLSGVAGRRKRPPGAAVGFGVEAVLLSQLIFPIITGAFGDVLGSAWTDRIKPKGKAARAAAKGKATSLDAGSDGRTGSEGSAVAVTLSAVQAQGVHDACLRYAESLGMAAAKAELLADAVVGSLRPTRSG
jgi:hypothetical protein